MTPGVEAGSAGRTCPRAPELLERAVSYALDSVASVRPALMRRPTPCRGWDLDALLSHACESVQVLQEAIATGRVSLAAAAAPSGLRGNAALVFARHAVALVETWSRARPQPVLVGGCELAAGLLAEAAALEIAVHGWDIFQASGDERPIPAPLARDLAVIAPTLVTEADRGVLFARPVAVGTTASPSEQLTAFLGRAPSSCRGPRRLAS
jgi:uncharacterized protein (TIGR03086 family)